MAFTAPILTKLIIIE